MTESMLALIAGLLAPQPAERAAAAERLARLEHAAQPAAVALVEAMGDPDDHVKNWVNAALEGLGPPSAEDLQPLVRLLTHESPDVAYWAATLLGRLQPAAAPAVAALAAALTNRPEMPVRQRAAWALGEIGQVESARQSLEHAAAGSNPRLSRLAKQALKKLR